MNNWQQKIGQLETLERNMLQKGAAFSKDHRREKHEESQFWLPYKEDVERIIHSKALRRYSDKTQVVYLMENDHLTHRGVHVQLVSSYARGVARLLNLNVDLVEAISLGHDVGHPPFGHEGEGYLSAISKEKQLGAFSHSSQSCRLFRLIEPLNLSFAVYDGFLCHDGGMKKRLCEPFKEKSWSDHFAEVEQRKISPEKDFQPATLEGCLVKMCDSVSYLAKDIEDAIGLGIIKREDIPKTVLGATNSHILRTAASDLVQESADRPHIAFSEEVFESLKKLRAFNFERIYNFQALKVESQKIKRAYGQLFDLLHDDFKTHGKKSRLYKNFLHSKSKDYLDATVEAHYVLDYIAGMTDRYFVNTLEQFVVPQTITLSTDVFTH